MKIRGYTPSRGKISNDGPLLPCCKESRLWDQISEYRVDFSSSVTVKKRRENILPAIKVLTFEKLDINHCRGQRVYLQVDLIPKK